MDAGDIKDFVGEEHFPDCPCFSQPGSLVPSEMYAMAQQWSSGIVGVAIEEGFCPQAIPYLIAMATDMAIAELGARLIAERHPEMKRLTPATSMEYAQTQHEIHAVIRGRLAALEKRGLARCSEFTEGSNSVQ